MKVFVSLVLILGTTPVWSQMWTYDDQAIVNPWESGNREITFDKQTFTFARLRYTPRGRRYGWDTDYPDSDINFSTRLSELTTINVNRDRHGRVVHVVLDLEDDRIFDFPFVYMVEVGNLELDQYQAKRLREYLFRGGFLMVDDFWGDRGWWNWQIQIEKVFPDQDVYPMVDIPMDHPIFNAVFPLDTVPQVPSVQTWMYSRSETEVPGVGASAYGIFSKTGRLMAVILHNTDLGDGWEREGMDYEYFRKFSAARAYPFGVNIVVYAMTH